MLQMPSSPNSDNFILLFQPLEGEYRHGSCFDSVEFCIDYLPHFSFRFSILYIDSSCFIYLRKSMILRIYINHHVHICPQSLS